MDSSTNRTSVSPFDITNAKNEKYQPSVADEDQMSTKSSQSSTSLTSIFSEVEIAENEIAWSCMVCKEVNIQEKKVHTPSNGNNRLGTKENASRVIFTIRNTTDLKNNYKVKFKMKKNTNYCRKCFTPYDYKPRNRSLKHEVFHDPPLRDSIFSINQDNTSKSRKQNIDSSNPTLLESFDKSNDEYVDRFHVASQFNIWQILNSSDLSKMNKFRCLQAKIKLNYRTYVLERCDPPPVEPNHEKKLYYNNFYSKKFVEKHFPSYSRKVLGSGERYKEGEWVESNEDRPDGGWYVCRIIKVRQNYKYDIRYDNGQFAECVEHAKIRHRIHTKLSIPSKIIIGGWMFLFVVVPISLSYDIWFREFTMHNSKQKIRPYFEQPFNIIINVMILIVTSLFCSQIRIFWMSARAGVKIHSQLFLFCSFPYWMIIITFKLLKYKALSLQSYSETELKWWECAIASITSSLACNMHMFCNRSWWGYMGFFVSIPLIIFKIIAALFGDNVIQISMHLLFLPLQLFAILLIFIRILIPFLREPMSL